MSFSVLAGPAAAQPRDPIEWIRGSTVSPPGGIAISADGRYVVWAEPFIPMDGTVNAYIHDRETGMTRPLPLPGVTSMEPAIDVRVGGVFHEGGQVAVAVTTEAPLLRSPDATCTPPAEDCNDADDAYYVVLGGAAQRVSTLRSPSGGEAPFGGVVFGATAVGSYGGLMAWAGNRLTLPDDNAFFEVYYGAPSIVTGRVTLGITAGGPNGPIKNEVAISPGGGNFAFVSRAGNLVVRDDNTTWDVFVGDITGGMERVSVRSNETEVSAPSGDIGQPGAQVALSAGGRYVAFMSAANDLVPGDRNTLHDIFVRDRLLGETYLVTGDPACGDRTGSNLTPTISHDGSIVAFASYDPCYNGGVSTKQAVVVNRLTGETAVVSAPITGEDPDGQVELVRIADHGGRVVFDSTSTNISMTPITSGGPRRLFTTTPFRDRDGDGLLDAWEEGVIDRGRDGTPELDLPSLGANPNHKDIFVEVDWLVAADHSHRPSAIALRQVEQAFAAAPVMNPDGSGGVRVHFVFGDAIAESEVNDALALDGDFGSYYAVRQSYFGEPGDRVPGLEDRLAVRRLALRYMFIGHSHTESTRTGEAEMPGDDILVTLGAFAGGIGTVDQQAGTIMHELGHALGLDHGGEDAVNCKPNYVSVMSYAFQFPILVPERPLDFSRRFLLPLNEGALDERIGLDGMPGQLTVFGPPHRMPLGLELVVSAADAPIDWSVDGDTADIAAANINQFDVDGCTGEPLGPEMLTPSEDWSRIIYNHRRTRGYALGAAPPEDFPDAEMTREVYDMLVDLAPGPPNALPIAVVGAPVTVDEGADVVLDGSGSSDPEGAPITYTWLQATGPSGMLAAADTAMPTFTAPQVDADTVLEVELAVHDGVFYSVAVWQRVTVIDRGGPPADGGPGADGGDSDLPDGSVADAGGGGGGGGCGCRAAGPGSPATPLPIVFTMLVLAGWTRRRGA